VSRVVPDAPFGAVPAALSRDRAVARLHALTAIAKAATGATGFMDALRRTSQAAMDALEAASVSISVWERDQATVRVLVNTGDLGPGEVSEPVDETYQVTDYPFITRMFADGVGFVQLADAEPDAAGSDPNLVRLLRLLRKGSGLSVPIVLESRVWGELFATRDLDAAPFEQSDVDFATAVAGQVAAGIAQAQHVESVARLAYTDPLTGLANRRAVDDRLDAALDRHHRDGTVVSLVVVDVNGLKRINDDRGHEAGDRALVHFAGLLAASAGLLPGSLAGRSGGDEFCVVVEGSTSDHVVWLAEDLCRRANAALDEGIACGVASTDDPIGPVPTPSRLFRLADAAQSRAKRSRARHPVVAGRGLPQDATVRLADAAEQMPRSQTPRGDRRRVRSRRGFSYLLDDVLETLDHSGAVGSQARLEVVADAVCRLVDGCSWWVSRTDESHSVLQTVSYSAIRYGGGLVADREAVLGGTSTFALADYPLSSRMLAGNGGVVAVDDPLADPAERAILEGAGYTALVMAGATDLSGAGWLVEVYVDDIAGDVSSLASALRALTACAILPPPPPPPV
jgi:diguanylate cyclase (GGDEF)-like protein